MTSTSTGSARLLPFSGMLRGPSELIQQQQAQMAREFRKGIMIRRLSQNRLRPEQPTPRGDGVGEAQCLLGVPVGGRRAYAVPPRVLGEDQTDHAEQSEQAGGRSQDTLGHALPRRLEAQVGTHFLKGGLDRPAGGEPTDDLFRVQARIGRVEVLIAMDALEIVDEDPPEGNSPAPAL